MTKEQFARARRYFRHSNACRGMRSEKGRYANKHNAHDVALEAFELLERIWHGCLRFDGGAVNCVEDVLDDMEALFK